MKELNYSYNALQQFCIDNSIELCRDYLQEVVNQKTRIEGTCTTNGCKTRSGKIRI